MLDGRTLENIVFDYPVIGDEAYQDQQGSQRNHRRIHVSEPNYLNCLGKQLAQRGRVVHHQLVGLPLGQVRLAVVDLSLHQTEELQGVD